MDIKKSNLLITGIILLSSGMMGCGMFDQKPAYSDHLVFASEHTGADCEMPPLPDFDDLPEIDHLPDPFTWADGSGRITSKEDWRCRRAEIGAQIQYYETGVKPNPPEQLTAQFVEDTLLTVTIVENGVELELSARIRIPDGDGPFPAVIGVGMFGEAGSLPPDIFTSRGIATIQYNFSELAPWGFDIERGTGGFYDLYPDPKVGSFTAWSWGVSRIIDGLEQTPETRIDLSRLAITGCSFAGKIALFSGAFDERIALTIAQEPGGGGDAAWRVSETLEGSREVLKNAQGAPWYHEDLSQFNEAVTRLPFDHHELMGMIAPRALFVLGNIDYEWLADESGHVASLAAHEIWKALGVPDRFGFSKTGGHSHCQLPDNQRPEVVAFVEKFLLGDETADTEIYRSPHEMDLAPWIVWDTPELD